MSPALLMGHNAWRHPRKGHTMRKIEPVDPGREPWDPTKGRKAAAWLAMAEYLKTGEWYRRFDLYDVGREASGLSMSEVASRFKGALRYGLVEKMTVKGVGYARVTPHGVRTRPELRQDSE